MLHRTHTTDPANDALVAHPRLDSYRWNSGFLSLCDIGHQGLLHDREFGLVYNRARYLHPKMGRFTGPDPLNQNRPGGGYQDGMSRFEYVGSRPARRLDPLGLWQGEPENVVEQQAMIDIALGVRSTSGTPGTTTYTANGDSIYNTVRGLLPSAKGAFTPIDSTLVWVPYPGGHAEVTINVSGAISNCCTEEGELGAMAEVSVTITGKASLGYGVGGNKGKKAARKPGNGGGSGLRYRRGTGRGGQYAGGETGWGVPSLTGELSSGTPPPCKTQFVASASIEVGGKAGVGLTANPFASVTFATYDPIAFSYGVRMGFELYVGAEAYVLASGSGGGGTLPEI